MEGYFVSESELGDRAVRYIYARNSYDTVLPTLCEARGKIVILQDFKSSLAAMASLRIRALSLFIVASLQNPGKLHITYTTANASIEPIRIAAKDSIHPGMNVLLDQCLRRGEGNYPGVAVMDFPGDCLDEKILMRNNHYLLPELTTYFPDRNARDTAEEVNFNSISDFEPPPLEDTNDESSDNEIFPTLPRSYLVSQADPKRTGYQT
ncbi:1-phosphatidylinositol phosphodiesterase [Ceratocystis lukuohia]|uniref:1-phosphatidylinositol phosphodiesterase n=1 Tax=Ceratocystis lukuohia TaxID=2019550 RepID=A0ABR4MAA4_9PEZI